MAFSQGQLLARCSVTLVIKLRPNCHGSAVVYCCLYEWWASIYYGKSRESTYAIIAEDVSQADDLLGQVVDLQAKSMAILGKAKEAGDLRTALMAVRE